MNWALFRCLALSLLICIASTFAWYEVRIQPSLHEPTSTDKGIALVRQNSTWGAICDDGWDINDARVFCRMLGFWTAAEVFHSSRLGYQDFPFLLDDLACYGNETNLGQCRSSPFGSHNCFMSEQAGVRCTNTEVNACLQNPCQNNGTCISTLGNATCLCSGYWTGNFCENYYNPCIPSPCKNIGYCISTSEGARCLCESQWTGRFCETDTPQYEVRIQPPGNDSNSTERGTALVRHNSTWGVICDHGWDLIDAHVFCRMLGFLSSAEVFTSSSLGVISYPILLDDLECNGREETLGNCWSSPFGTHNCSPSEQAGVRCTNTEINPCLMRGCWNGGTCILNQGRPTCVCKAQWTGILCEYDYSPCISSPCQNNGTCISTSGAATCLCESSWTGRFCETAYVAPRYEVRILPLDNETSSTTIGTALVKYNSIWGVICDDSWDINDANVFCRMLGFRRAAEVFSSSVFGFKNYPFLLDDLACTGSETNLAECRSSPFGSHDCGPSEQAGVRCTRCLENWCNGRGTCLDTPSGSITCSCNPGYTSSRCETEVNMCLPSPCRNSGTCQSRPGNFTCICSARWTGRLCEKDANVIRRLDIVAVYKVLCTRLADVTIKQALQYLVNYRYSDIESILSGIARRSADTNVTSVCVNGNLTVTWPTSLIYPPTVTSVPLDVVNRIPFNSSCNVLELMVVSSNPVVLNPVMNPRSQIAVAKLTSYCRNKMTYSAVTDSCTTTVG